MEFGLLKSKIETKLVESYKKDSFNTNIKTFKKLVLENKEVSKMFYLYDELSKEKGYEKSFADDYLNECIGLIEKITINKKTISLLESWVKDVKSENHYKDIDTVVNKNTVVVENIINSKNTIINHLITKKDQTNVINVSYDTMVEVANSTLKNYLNNISESELKEIKKYSTLSQSELDKRYDVVSEMVIEKLENLSSKSDLVTKTKITETIDKIKNEKVDSVSLFKLKSLNEIL
jgi:DNA-binding transcriptional regulator YiaG